MYVCHKLKVVYFGVPRTASRSVARFLQEDHKAVPIRNKSPGGAHHNIAFPELNRCRELNYRVIATVRNPWDIIVSWWHHNQNWFGRGNAEFEKFVRRFPMDGRNQYLCEDRMYLRYTREATHVIKYERLKTDLQRVLRVPVELPSIGVSDRQLYSRYYNAELRDFVAEAFAEEIEQYRYTFKGRLGS